MLKISSKMMRKHKRLVNRLNTRILFTHLHMSCASPKWILVCGADAISWKLLIWILPDYIASITASSAMCPIGTFGLVKFQYSTFQFIGSDWIKHNDNNKIQIAFSYLFSGSRKTSASMCTLYSIGCRNNGALPDEKPKILYENTIKAKTIAFDEQYGIHHVELWTQLWKKHSFFKFSLE